MQDQTGYQHTWLTILFLCTSVHPCPRLYAKGLIYALNSRAVWSVIIHNYDNLRLITNEDANMGLWMLASNVNRYEDLRLCHMKCQ